MRGQNITITIDQNGGIFKNYYNLIESFWIAREKVEEDFLTNNEIEAIREIEKLLETIKEIIFEQDEDDADTRRVILNLFNYLMYLIKEVVDESDNNINICFN
jgi:Mg2+ and Co2+ transporter CorA